MVAPGERQTFAVVLGRFRFSGGGARLGEVAERQPLPALVTEAALQLERLTEKTSASSGSPCRA